MNDVNRTDSLIVRTATFALLSVALATLILLYLSGRRFECAIAAASVILPVPTILLLVAPWLPAVLGGILTVWSCRVAFCRCSATHVRINLICIAVVIILLQAWGFLSFVYPMGSFYH